MNEDTLDSEVNTIKDEMRELDKRMDSVDRKLSILNEDVLHIRADYRKLDRRLLEIEESRA